jgi:hypothetical protein
MLVSLTIFVNILQNVATFFRNVGEKLVSGSGAQGAAARGAP